MGLFAVRHSEREKRDKKKLKGKARRYTCACRSEKKIQSAETRCGKPVIKFATVNQVRASGSMPDENHSDCKRGSSERGEMWIEVKRSLPKRDGRTSVNKIGQTDRSSERKRHLKFLIGDNRDNDQTNVERWRT